MEIHVHPMPSIKGSILGSLINSGSNKTFAQFLKKTQLCSQFPPEANGQYLRHMDPKSITCVLFLRLCISRVTSITMAHVAHPQSYHYPTFQLAASSVDRSTAP